MNITRLIDDYTFSNKFEIKYCDNNVELYYYDKILSVSNEKVEIIKDEKKYIVKGKNLLIDTLFKEMIVIKGEIKEIVFGD